MTNPNASGTRGTVPRKRRGLRVVVYVCVLALAASGYMWNRYPLNKPVTYTDPAEHFKYGSIGGDVENGLPLEVMRVLPKAFPEYLPKGKAAIAHDYTAFGFLQEPGHDMPIGFSTRQRLIPRVGFNCAPCHTGSWQARAEEQPVTRLGMPAANLDLGAYFQFLFATAADERFTADYLIPFMQQNRPLNVVDRLIYSRLVIPSMKKGLLARRDMFAPLFAGRPPFGHGRVDTFNPYKVNQLASYYAAGIPDTEKIGTADFPSIWGQAVREGMALNWDGNSPRKADRDIGAAFGAGATRESVDPQSIRRISDYLRALSAPAYPYGITKDSAQLRLGEHTYQQNCARCHSVGNGSRVGTVEPLTAVRTDPHRLNSYTERLNQLLKDYGSGYSWQIIEMRKTNGYANQPLDGVWARAPYLHNGSVPTLWDLLTPDNKRNGGKPVFWTGTGLYDTVNVGIRTDVPEANGRPATLFDTRVVGNSNQGHSGAYYGTDLPVAEKRALIEYLKTLH